MNTIDSAEEHSKEGDKYHNYILEKYGYDVIKKLASGTFSKVVLADSKRQQHHVAVKIITKSDLPQSLLDKFIPREIFLIKTLKHENILNYFQCIETSHRYYIVMEYAEHGTLLDLINRENYLNISQARTFFKQIISVLEYCHSHSVVHRDIKCENLLLCSENTIKLGDFGFARSMLEAGKSVVLSKTFCGSYAYASPELLRGIPYQPQTADIWAAGVVLFSMVFGKMPFNYSNLRELVKWKGKLTSLRSLQ
ncbi:testis-specific serine/threonine-protein kinase 2-like isoform X2 [Hermetia illucens]|uniref:testis-specific serine/threonine-protein kinase 2-like isoform X2 n=1 Tax=Hermetia illucens TaxID=343691 RepID=UPI0018CBF45A|nr:testis-specific serine/threonine-protein kinase 2-like isoform X2 [Hermetia illucens]